jgi:DNA-binding HxlR family transcriptional regulator
MATGLLGTNLDSRADNVSIPGTLRLLSGGAAGEILLALRSEPLQTGELIESVPGYSPRTLYRYLARLTGLRLIERKKGSGVPSRVVYRLTELPGRAACGFVEAYAADEMALLANGRIDSLAWTSLGTLAQLWESGMLEALSSAPLSATDLAQEGYGLSYHQISRRASGLAASGLIQEERTPGRRRCYSPSNRTRRAMGLLARIGSWLRSWHAAGADEVVTAADVALMLRVALPLVKAPQLAGKHLQIEVEDARLARSVVSTRVTEDGKTASSERSGAGCDGWAAGDVGRWLEAVGGNTAALDVAGDKTAVAELLTELHSSLWTPSPS